MFLGFSMQWADTQETRDDQLKQLLSNTAKYCEELKKRAFHFLCYEHIKERIESSVDKAAVRSEQRQVTPYFRSLSYAKPNIYKNKYVNEYQIIKQKGNIRERRIMIDKNGKKVNIKDPGFETLLYSYKSALSPIYFFAAENQEKFRYNIRKKETVMGRRAYAVEVRPKTPPANGEDLPLAVVSVDREDYSVLKFKLFSGDFSPENIVGSTRHNVTNIKVEDVHFFGVQKDGIRYPSETQLFLTYNGGPTDAPIYLPRGGRLFTKVKTTFTYKKYIFFNVSVGSPVYFTDHYLPNKK